jgi:DNA-directed RNA polymerase specialized sigma24 family protein
MPQAKKTTARKPAETLSVEAALTGLLALAVADGEAAMDPAYKPAKTVTPLHDVGLSVDDIAAVTGKNAPTVAKAIQRDRQTKEKEKRKPTDASVSSDPLANGLP